MQDASRRLWTVLLAALWLIASPAGAASDALHAARIEANNAEQLRVGGPDAIGGIGDWAIGNGTLCAVISDPSHESILSASGGVLIDLAHCDRPDDQFNALQPLMNMARSDVIPVTEIEARLDREAGTASIVTIGRRIGVSIETRYELSKEKPLQLRIVSRLRREAPGDRAFLLADIALHGHRQLSGFALSSRRLENSTGFHHAPLDPYRPFEMLGAIVAADTQVMVGGDALSPSISYGLQLIEARLVATDGVATPVQSLTVNGEDFSMLGVFARPLWIGEDEVGVLALAQTLLMDIEPGETLLVERAIHVGDRADVASVTDQIWPDAPVVRGRVSDPAARLHIALPSGAPVTFVRPDPDGTFSFRVPAGAYRLIAKAPAGRSLTRDIQVTSDLDLGTLSVGAITRVQLPRGQAMRLAFLSQERANSVHIGDDLLDFRIGGKRIPASTESRDVSLAGIANDPKTVDLAPGHYDVFATRGLEHAVTRASIALSAGETKRLDIAAPARVLQTPGWIGADLHIHSEWSDDSALPRDMRIASFAAQGGEVMVPTEHDHVVDFAPRIRELGLSQRIANVIGAEVTSTSQSEAAPTTFGHANVFPIAPQPLEFRGGVPKSEGRRLRNAIGELRSRDEQALIQLNHPRSSGDSAGDGAFFNHLSKGTPFVPTLPLTQAPNASLLETDAETGLRDLDFHLIELMNGPSLDRYRRIRADWFSLLLQGEIRTATANSDSHGVGEVVALPMNYVRVRGDSIPGFSQDEFIRALRAGHSYGTTGPILQLELVGAKASAGIGDTFRGGEGNLKLEVSAAAWVDVSEVRVFVNGELVYGGTLEAGETQNLPLVFERDCFVTVEVEGSPGEIYRAVAPDFTPFAFTNPIFVDADVDGRWSAPGLPDHLPDTIAAPEVDAP